MAQKLKKKIKQKQVIIKKVVKKTVDSKLAPNTMKFVPKSAYVEGIGRRKTAVARVRIYEESGDFLVNGMSAGEYFKGIHNAPGLYNLPLQLTDTQGNWAINVVVNGSGIRSQLDAVVHGVSRALLKKSADYRLILKPKGLLTRDDRMKETRKVGMGGKARRKRQSPKR
ncbi:MAG: 30S ribosomal protein S9 [Patescibacteria group bacterium]